MIRVLENMANQKNCLTLLELHPRKVGIIPANIQEFVEWQDLVNSAKFQSRQSLLANFLHNFFHLCGFQKELSQIKIVGIFLDPSESL